MRDLTPDNITAAFQSYATAAPSVRARELLVALADHLHRFVKETRLTHEEWRAGLEALTRAAEITTPDRNEFVLFSDLFGVSSLVDMVNTPPDATSSSVLGPFHRHGAPALANGGDLWGGQAGDPLVITGRIVDAATGAPVHDALIDIWQNADNGLYAAQDPDQPAFNYHAQMTASGDGAFAFTTTRPQPYKVPYDGPAGDMLRALGRDAWRPAHIHFLVEAPGYRQLVTELFPSDDERLNSDATFGVRDDLVMPLRPVGRADAPPGLAAADQLPERLLRADLVIRLAPLGAGGA